MTVPTQHNCPHQGEGWCLDCVAGLAADADLYRRGYEAMGAADVSNYLALCATAKDVDILRAAVAEFLTAKGHDLCHENRRELAAAAGLSDLADPPVFPMLPPEPEFAARCALYRAAVYGNHPADEPAAMAEVFRLAGLDRGGLAAIEQQTPRSGAWDRVRDEHVRLNPECEACRRGTGLEVHHVRPYHLFPELELEPTNLMTFCRPCHYLVGHGGRSWADWNPDVRRLARYVRVYTSEVRAER